jgi:hypothetical protein
MILTSIAPERLDATLDRFAAGLAAPPARAAFALIRATLADRAIGDEAERHRRQALDFARAHDMAVHPPGTPCTYNWHEVAHYLLAPPSRRRLPDFGLGPGPDTSDRVGAERAAALPVLDREADEAAASLIGILWEAELGQPALASFLDQNWLEGLERSAAAHFTAVVKRLIALRLWSSG